MKSEVRPPYISRTISSRPRRPSAPRKNLPPAPNQTGPIGLPSRLTTSRCSPSTSIFSSVWVVFGPGVGDVVGPQRRRQDEDDDQDEEPERRRARPGCAAAAAGQVPGAAPRRRRGPGRLELRLATPPIVTGARAAYLNWKLVRSWPKVGLKITLSRSIALETKVETVARCRRAPRAPVPCIPCPARRIRLPASGPSGSSPSLAIFAFSSGIVDLGEVGVVGRQDAFAGEQRLEEVVRVRVVLEPVDPAGVEVGRRLRCRSS